MTFVTVNIRRSPMPLVSRPRSCISRLRASKSALVVILYLAGFFVCLLGSIFIVDSQLFGSSVTVNPIYFSPPQEYTMSSTIRRCGPQYVEIRSSGKDRIKCGTGTAGESRNAQKSRWSISPPVWTRTTSFILRYSHFSLKAIIFT